ncbi:glucan synthase, putative [Anopheles sinensis]|uniref:Glucan synthase, putative n=1 Tax=Anopheles sinensis TaxID=74873 RepID=A0A084VF86_ANOSI|nr:glucan synthase, putative [Anopheles sinensis]
MFRKNQLDLLRLPGEGPVRPVQRCPHQPLTAKKTPKGGAARWEGFDASGPLGRLVTTPGTTSLSQHVTDLYTARHDVIVIHAESKTEKITLPLRRVRRADESSQECTGLGRVRDPPQGDRDPQARNLDPVGSFYLFIQFSSPPAANLTPEEGRFTGGFGAFVLPGNHG